MRDVQSIMHESDTLEGVLGKMVGLQIATCRTWLQHADSPKKDASARDTDMAGIINETRNQAVATMRTNYNTSNTSSVILPGKQTPCPSQAATNHSIRTAGKSVTSSRCNMLKQQGQPCCWGYPTNHSSLTERQSVKIRLQTRHAGQASGAFHQRQTLNHRHTPKQPTCRQEKPCDFTSSASIM